MNMYVRQCDENITNQHSRANFVNEITKPQDENIIIMLAECDVDVTMC